MNTATAVQLADLANRLGLAVGLTCDPAADPRERWLCVVGLDSYGAGEDPAAAISAAVADLSGQRIASAS